MAPPGEFVFLFDVDNTLFDNDRFQEDLKARLASELGAPARDSYWSLLEELRSELGYVDYLGALERYRNRAARNAVSDPQLLQMASFLLDYPFAEHLYPHALRVLDHCSRYGRTVLLTDGEIVFQPRKIQRSGLLDAVGRRVLLYVHKEEMLEDVALRYPAQHYIMVDDKLRILSAMKALWGDRLTSVFPRQGHYALDAREVAAYPAADISLDSIGDLLRYDLASLLAPAAAQNMEKT